MFSAPVVSPARRLALAALSIAAVGLASACADSTGTTAPAGPGAPARDPDRGVRRHYGPPTKVGRGRARAYVAVDARTRAPLELGVALDADAMEGLPAPVAMPPGHGGGHEHVDMHVYDLKLPAQNPTPFQFVELDWNPGGHEPPGIYDVPHFDFHFYTITPAQRNAIDPVALGEAQFLAKSGNLPPEAERAPFHVALAAPGQPVVAVPRMGVHWSDMRSPELQGMLGNPAGYRPFTTTFTYGSWDGRFIFAEPMVTRAFILDRRAATEPARRDSVIALSTAQQYRPAGA